MIKCGLGTMKARLRRFTYTAGSCWRLVHTLFSSFCICEDCLTSSLRLDNPGGHQSNYQPLFFVTELPPPLPVLNRQLIPQVPGLLKTAVQEGHTAVPAIWELGLVEVEIC